MEEMVNPFRKYIDETGEKIFAFAKRAFISPSTLYHIYEGVKPRKRLALKICKHSKEKITMRDFGYD